ncbi:MAG: hypothetical protein ACI4EL_00955 [Candidatus Fimimorpha sp.]
MKQNKWKLYLYALIVSIGMILPIKTQAAAIDQKGSITIFYHGTVKGGLQINLANAKFIVYRVGDYQNGKWILNETFRDCPVLFESDSSTVQIENAKKLLQFAIEKNVPGIVQETDSLGKTIFHELEQGVYLVAQKEILLYEDGHFKTLPFVASIPMESDGELISHILAEPKTEWRPGSIDSDNNNEGSETSSETGGEEASDPNTSSGIDDGGNKNNAQTGDDIKIITYVVILVLSSGILILLLIKSSKNKKKKG